MENPRQRKKYDPEFKRETLRQLAQSGQPTSVFAKSVGVDRSNLQKWKKLFGDGAEIDDGPKSGAAIDISEFESLKQELQTVKETVFHLRNIVKRSFQNKY